MRDIARELDERLVAVVEIGRQNVDVDDPALAVPIPFGRPVFHRIIADGDNQIRGVEQTIRGLIGQLSDAAAEVVEQHGTDCTTRL